MKRREDALARGDFLSMSLSFGAENFNSKCFLFSLILAAGIVIEEKNWPPIYPIIHHDIENEIPVHLQKLQYVAFTTYLGNVN